MRRTSGGEAAFCLLSTGTLEKELCGAVHPNCATSDASATTAGDCVRSCAVVSAGAEALQQAPWSEAVLVAGQQECESIAWFIVHLSTHGAVTLCINAANRSRIRRHRMRRL